MTAKIKPVKQRVYVPIDDITWKNIGDVFAFVNVGGKPRLVHHVPTAIDAGALAPEFLTDTDFVKMFINKRKRVLVDPDPDDFDTKPKLKNLSIAELFLKSKHRRTYDRLVFEANASRVSPTDYNMWSGFAVEPKKGDWSLMRAMMEESLANADFEHFLWILKWCAWGVQNPTERAGVCLTIRSDKQGTGKGLLGRTLCKFFGSHSQHMHRQNSVTARFNSQLAQCAMLFEDESDFAGDKAAAAMMKGLITEPTLDIEKKGLDVIRLPNCLKIYKATNHSWAAPVEAGDRRYAVFNTNDEMANDKKYFEPIYRQLRQDDGAGYSAMLYDLLALNLKGWKPSDEIPETEARAEQKTLTLPAEDKWLLGFLESGVLPYTNPKWPSRMTQQARLYEDAKRSSRDLSFWTSPQFSRHLDKWGIVSKTSNGHYRDFGSLRELRAKWMDRYPWYNGFGSGGEWTHERSEYDESPDDHGFG